MYTVDQILQQINDVTRTLTRASGLLREGGGGGGGHLNHYPYRAVIEFVSNHVSLLQEITRYL